MAFSISVASQEILATVMSMVAQRTGFSFTLQPTQQIGDTQFYSCRIAKESFGILRFAIHEAVADLRVDSVKYDYLRGVQFQYLGFRIDATVHDYLQGSATIHVALGYVYRPDLNQVFEFADYEKRFPEP